MSCFTIEGEVIKFGEFVDELITRELEEALTQVVVSNKTTIIDLTDSRMVDATWLRLITLLCLKGNVMVRGASKETTKAASILGYLLHWRVES